MHTVYIWLVQAVGVTLAIGAADPVQLSLSPVHNYNSWVYTTACTYAKWLYTVYCILTFHTIFSSISLQKQRTVRACLWILCGQGKLGLLQSADHCHSELTNPNIAEDIHIFTIKSHLGGMSESRFHKTANPEVWVREPADLSSINSEYVHSQLSLILVQSTLNMFTLS